MVYAFGMKIIKHKIKQTLLKNHALFFQQKSEKNDSMSV